MSVTDPAVAQPWPLAASGHGLRMPRQVGGWVLPAVDIAVLVVLIPVVGVHWLLGAGFALAEIGRAHV